jgi:xylulokinase
VGGIDRLVELVGNRMFPGYTGGKIIWLRDHEPENYAKMVHLLNPKDYIRFRMTGLYVTDVSDASGTGLFDVRNRTWSLEALDAIGVDPALLPDVFGGGGDAVIQTTAMGLVEEGSAGFTVGTAGIVAGGLSRYPENPGGKVQVSCGNAPGHWHIMGNANSAGGAFQWLRDALTPLDEAEKLSFETLIGLARKVEPGANGVLFLPYLLGERAPNLAPDASAAFVGLTQMHDISHMSRALLEGVLMNMREILDICISAGLQSDQVIASGGVTNESLWLQMLADILGREVVTQVGASEGGAYGAVLAAGVGSGVWPDLISALTQVKVEKTYLPDDDAHAKYQTVFGAHRKLHAAMTDVYELARTAEGAA